MGIAVQTRPATQSTAAVGQSFGFAAVGTASWVVVDTETMPGCGRASWDSCWGSSKSCSPIPATLVVCTGRSF